MGKLYECPQCGFGFGLVKLQDVGECSLYTCPRCGKYEEVCKGEEAN